MRIKYAVSMSNHVPGGCAQMMMLTLMPMQDDANDDDGQSMIV